MITYLTRIAYNAENWRRPSGDAKRHEKGTHNEWHGFGHEDWLFRNEWTIGGWRYAFIEGVGKSYQKLFREDKRTFNLILFSIFPKRSRRYVAEIRDVEVLSAAQCKDAVTAFKQLGWFEQMKSEIAAVGGDPSVLANTVEDRHILNVRFKVADVIPFPQNTLVVPDSMASRTKRYNMSEVSSSDATVPRASRRRGTSTPPNTKSRKRKGTAATDVSLEHAKMQELLMQELAVEFPGADILREMNNIDVLVDANGERFLYEIKSEVVPRYVIRYAIGQLLEYAYFYEPATSSTIHLVIVGRTPLSLAESSYLERLKDTYGIDLMYRVVAID